MAESNATGSTITVRVKRNCYLSLTTTSTNAMVIRCCHHSRVNSRCPLLSFIVGSRFKVSCWKILLAKLKSLPQILVALIQGKQVLKYLIILASMVWVRVLIYIKTHPKSESSNIKISKWISNKYLLHSAKCLKQNKTKQKTMQTTDTIIYSGDSQFSLYIRVSEILIAKQMNKKVY